MYSCLGNNWLSCWYILCDSFVFSQSFFMVYCSSFSSEGATRCPWPVRFWNFCSKAVFLCTMHWNGAPLQLFFKWSVVSFVLLETSLHSFLSAISILFLIDTIASVRAIYCGSRFKYREHHINRAVKPQLQRTECWTHIAYLSTTKPGNLTM